MFISKISFNTQTNRNYNMRTTNSQTFGYRAVLTKPSIKNESGKRIYDKAIKYLQIMPERAKTVKPISVNIEENGIVKNYGIEIEKAMDSCMLLIRDMGNAEAKQLKCQINERGKMVMGEYGDLHFYRTQSDKCRRIETPEARYSPVDFGSDTWGLTTYGETDKALDNREKDKDALGSIFWAMTGHNVSIFGK